jgi:hypothetical protein
MILFNYTQIFTSGTSRRKVIDLPDTDLLLIDEFITAEDLLLGKVINKAARQCFK